MIRRSLILTVMAFVTACANSNTNPNPARTAQLSELRNTVETRAGETMDWQAAVEGDGLTAGGGVRTGDDARARLDISDGTIMRLASNTDFTLLQFTADATDPVTQWSLSAGKLWISVTKALGAGSFEVETPNGVASVRGSLMGVEYYPANGHMIITCLEGECRLTQPTTGKSTDLTTGQQTGIPGFGRDPGAARDIDVVRLGEWATFFPESLPIVTTITPGPPPTSTPVR